MKIQVRRGVFETNSSSTHSLQLTSDTIEEIKMDLWQRIAEDYNDDYNYDHIEDYIKGNTLFLEGFELPDGEESSHQYGIIDSWIMKLQFLAMVIYSNREDLEGIDTKALGWDYTPQAMSAIYKTEAFKAFETLAKNYCKKQGYEIEEVILDIKYSEWNESSIGFNNKMFQYDPYHSTSITAVDVTDAFNKVMRDDFKIVFMDEAYHPYQKPEITVF